MVWLANEASHAGLKPLRIDIERGPFFFGANGRAKYIDEVKKLPGAKRLDALQIQNLCGSKLEARGNELQKAAMAIEEILSVEDGWWWKRLTEDGLDLVVASKKIIDTVPKESRIVAGVEGTKITPIKSRVEFVKLTATGEISRILNNLMVPGWGRGSMGLYPAHWVTKLQVKGREEGGEPRVDVSYCLSKVDMMYTVQTWQWFLRSDGIGNTALSDVMKWGREGGWGVEEKLTEGSSGEPQEETTPHDATVVG
jgi:hypothetical protein